MAWFGKTYILSFNIKVQNFGNCDWAKTRDPQPEKLVPYQLSFSRITGKSRKLPAKIKVQRANFCMTWIN